MDKRDRKYQNEEITVFWKPSECIHATICYKDLLEVFNPSTRPWINLDGATNDKIINIVERCPTDALTYSYNDGRKSTKPPEGIDEEEIKKGNENDETPVNVEIIKGGPLLIKGNFTLTGEGENRLRNVNSAYFCRCSQSKNMPFCDGSHRKSEFDK